MDKKRFLDKFKYKLQESKDREGVIHTEGICNPDCEVAYQGCGSCQTGCQTNCQKGCERSCQKSCQCSDEGCQSRCEHSCQCSVEGCQTCQKACEKHCMEACEHGCQETCEKSCQCSDEGCQNRCEHSCQCSVEGCQTCQKACEKHCMEACEHGCQETCEKSCQCSDEGCQNRCEHSCQCSVEGCQTCQKACEKHCMEACEHGCQETCEKSCQCSDEGCQNRCEHSCQCSVEGCQTCQKACEKHCMEVCEHECQKACEKSCQCSDEGCQTTCEHECQNCLGKCETTCQKSCQCSDEGCQNRCEHSCQCYVEGCQTCQKVCEYECQKACEKSCQCSDEGCQTTCEHECQNCLGKCETTCQKSCQCSDEGCQTCQTTCEHECQNCEGRCECSTQICDGGCQCTGEHKQQPCGEGVVHGLEPPNNINVSVNGNDVIITFSKGKNAYKTILNLFIKRDYQCKNLKEKEEKVYIGFCKLLKENSNSIIPCNEAEKALEDIHSVEQNDNNLIKILKEETVEERFEINGLQYGQEYIFKLKSISKDGEESEWTEYSKFNIADVEPPKVTNIDVLGNHVKITFTKGENADETVINGNMITLENLEPTKGEVFEFTLRKDKINEVYRKKYTFKLQSIAKNNKKSLFTKEYYFENDIKPYLKLGDKNYKVGIIKNYLKLINYSHISLDNSFDSNTMNAIAQIQKNIKENIDNKIKLDGNIYIGIIKYIQDILVSKDYAFRKGIMNNEKLKGIQEKLYAFGYYKLANNSLKKDIDGDFGPNTFNAVRDFQEKDDEFKYYSNYYEETSSLGFADPMTIDKLSEKYSLYSMGLSKEEIKEMQRKLIAIGYSCVLNGIYDMRTQDCIKYFKLYIGNTPVDKKLNTVVLEEIDAEYKKLNECRNCENGCLGCMNVSEMPCHYSCQGECEDGRDFASKFQLKICFY
ncbi:putative peptidoglycan binding domain protein [Clostridium tepidiprofundi DSM 19306]|uniref:Putative peptidoglycan binding domain protein n=1 Tax=Clostridium tepidiprofundi DSM 19306 TaxID=1121338 RepID=A0A151B051_9CLOT|nr:peptidoglycan-binding protein [Clostridium tepidiprofundi]KYH33281.1 putative peptidoglycan binding domain protein [Clostridium tepidiprofundi DSM 19306]